MQSAIPQKIGARECDVESDVADDALAIWSNASTLPKMRATMRVTTPEGSRFYEVDEGQSVILGRSASCEIVVADNSVSRRHCSVVLEGGRLHVTDLDSSQGIKKDGKLVAECELDLGEQIAIGLAALRLERVDQTPSIETEPIKHPSPATNPKLTQESLIGQSLGGYRILSMLGAGGQAVVYAAEQVRLGRVVALKVLRQPETGSTLASIAAFLEEARAAAALSDPSLVQVYDLGVDQDRHFLSMELVAGGSLASHIRQKGPLAWRELEPLLDDVVTALTVAHDAGIVHRDVKPANILLTKDGRAKLADLGLARGFGGEGDRKGTPAYMAPEQVRGEAADARADIYALGCTIYHALTGSPPFTGRSKEIIKQKLSGPAPRLPERSDVPAFLPRAVARLLALNPTERPLDLRATKELLSPSSMAPVARVRRSRPRQRHYRTRTSGWPWVLALVVAALLGAAALRLLR